MRIEYRDQQRKKIGRMEVDVAARPTRVPIIEPGYHEPQREAFLNWEGALDDSGRLRKCIACGCPDLFREKAFPQVTGLVVIMAFVGAIVGVLGLANNLPALLGLTALLCLDVAILVFSHRRLACYRCRTSYHDLPMARYHRPWDRAIAERHPAAASPTPAGVTLVARASQREFAGAGRSGRAESDIRPATASAAATFADSADLPLEEKSYFA